MSSEARDEFLEWLEGYQESIDRHTKGSLGGIQVQTLGNVLREYKALLARKAVR